MIGIGLAGLIDIIIFHAILQWHHTSSHAIVPKTMETLQINVLHDGLFLSFSLVITIVGIGILLFSHDAQGKYHTVINKKSLVGLMFIGFGGFNTIEGIINHHILQMHHVIEIPDPILFDLAFLALGGLAFLVTGTLLLRSQKKSNG